MGKLKIEKVAINDIISEARNGDVKSGKISVIPEKMSGKLHRRLSRQNRLT